MFIPETWLALTALIILCCTVLVGATTAFVRITDKNTPFDIGLLHGRAGVFALALLILSVNPGNETGEPVKAAIGLLIVTVLGGVALYYIIRRKGILPKSIIFIHGAFALTAVYTLLFGFPI